MQYRIPRWQKWMKTVKTRIDADPDPRASRTLPASPDKNGTGLFSLRWDSLSFLGCGDKGGGGAEGQTRKKIKDKCNYACMNWHCMHLHRFTLNQSEGMELTVSAQWQKSQREKQEKRVGFHRIRRSFCHFLLPHMQTCQRARGHSHLWRTWVWGEREKGAESVPQAP